MISRFALFVLVLAPMPAAADDRVFSVGSFERVRIDGPFEVGIVTGGSPGAKAAGDRQLIERIAIAVNGTTLTVRLGSGGWGEAFRKANAAPPVITLSTPRLFALAISADARASVNRMASQRVEVSVTGSGSMTIDHVEADQFSASLLGTGALTAGGRANRARLLTDGAGTIDTAAMVVKDLTVLLGGPGETRATARNTAQVTSTGLGKVTVGGTATCTVRAPAGGPVSCGRPR
jgi:hypothetical protein